MNAIGVCLEAKSFRRRGSFEVRKTRTRFSLSIVLAGVALGEGLRSDSPVSIRTTFAGRNTEGFPRKNPRIRSSYIAVPLAASLLRLISQMEARWMGQELESLRIGLCTEDAGDEAFVSLYERSQLPRRWRSNESLPEEWQCDELVARLVREGKYQRVASV